MITLQAKERLRKCWRLLLIGVIGTIIIVNWWPTKNLPYHWDSAGLVIPYAQYIYDHGISLPTSEYAYGAHGPLFMFLLAGSWKTFGHHPITAHMLTLFFGLTYLAMVYSLSKIYLKKGHSLLVVFLLSMSPVFLAQVSQVYIDLPVATFGLAGLVAFLRKSSKLSALWLSLALLTKESALITVGWTFMVSLKDVSWQKRSKYVWLLIPLFVYAIFLIFNKQSFGYFWFEPSYDRVKPGQWTITSILLSLTGQIDLFIFKQGRLGLLLLWSWGMLEYIGIKHVGTTKAGRLISHNLSMIFIGLTFFTLAGQAHARYYLLLFPHLYILGIWGLTTVSKSLFSNKVFTSNLFIVTILISFGLWSFSNWHTVPKKDGYYYESMDADRSFIYMLENWINAAKFLESNYPEAFILGSFPESYQLTNPTQGYVNKPLKFEHCVDYLKNSSTIKDDAVKIIYLHHYIPLQGSCEQIIAQNSGKLIRRFENNGWWVDLYRLP